MARITTITAGIALSIGSVAPAQIMPVEQHRAMEVNVFTLSGTEQVMDSGRVAADHFDFWDEELGRRVSTTDGLARAAGVGTQRSDILHDRLLGRLFARAEGHTDGFETLGEADFGNIYHVIFELDREMPFLLNGAIIQGDFAGHGELARVVEFRRGDRIIAEFHEFGPFHARGLLEPGRYSFLAQLGASARAGGFGSDSVRAGVIEFGLAIPAPATLAGLGGMLMVAGVRRRRS